MKKYKVIKELPGLKVGQEPPGGYKLITWQDNGGEALGHKYTRHFNNDYLLKHGYIEEVKETLADKIGEENARVAKEHILSLIRPSPMEISMVGSIERGLVLKIEMIIKES